MSTWQLCLTDTMKALLLALEGLQGQQMAASYVDSAHSALCLQRFSFADAESLCNKCRMGSLG